MKITVLYRTYDTGSTQYDGSDDDENMKYLCARKSVNDLTFTAHVSQPQFYKSSYTENNGIKWPLLRIRVLPYLMQLVYLNATQPSSMRLLISFRQSLASSSSLVWKLPFGSYAIVLTSDQQVTNFLLVQLIFMTFISMSSLWLSSCTFCYFSKLL